MTGQAETRTMTNAVLPITPGAVIGWRRGTEYGAAVLSLDIDTNEPQWWRVGLQGSWTPAKMLAMLTNTGTDWVVVGTIGTP